MAFLGFSRVLIQKSEFDWKKCFPPKVLGLPIDLLAGI